MPIEADGCGVISTVIGAGGFIGRRLVQALCARGDEVYTPQRGDPDVFHRHLGCVYYCAGLTADFNINPAATFEAHSAFLVRVVTEANYERLVYLSSTRLYDGLEVGREDSALLLSPANSRHLFDLTKALGEHFTLRHSRQGGCVARLACAYDVTQDATGFLPELLRCLPQQRSIKIDSRSDISRDYIHVNDVVRALIRIMEIGEQASIYNVASGVNISNAEIAHCLQRWGWHTSFRESDTPIAPSPVIAIDRLRSLGLEPVRLADFIDDYLERICTSCN